MSKKLLWILLTIASGWQYAVPSVNANPVPPDRDLPEEILRADIITEARSPIDGRALSAAEFAELVVAIEQQSNRSAAASVNPEVKNLLFLLRLRGFLRSVGIPIN